MPAPRPRLRRNTDPQQAVRARGEPMVWLCGGALAVCLLMVFGLLGFVLWQGMATFWPSRVSELVLRDGTVRLGEITRTSTFVPTAPQRAEAPEAVRAAIGDQLVRRRLIRTGHTGEDFHWVPDYLIQDERLPEWPLVVERQGVVEPTSYGRVYGYPLALLRDGQAVAGEPAEIVAQVDRELAGVHARNEQIAALRKHGIGGLSATEDDARLAARGAELRHGTNSAEHTAAVAAWRALEKAHEPERSALSQQIDGLLAEQKRLALRLRRGDGGERDVYLADIVRTYPANRLSFGERLGVFADRWWEFLTAEPRESNQEGGVWPAIFGTVLMTLVMSLLVVPLGVLAALYIREYAKGGLVISAIRVAVNNLAGVPSIVFGVFGLGFFCYIVGGSIDALFYPERLPNPTFGKGALIWASLTLALLTLPVVIVATEEALAAVPGSMREGSYACGASKWQTIRRIVLPRAMPGIMTGAILAMARGAGEVAPLMLVGAAKLVPDLPFDGEAPYLHPSRSFMHLGFHIYDLGFQSQNSEAAKPMVFTTTLLLIGVIVLLNVCAIWLRSRLRRKFVAAQF